MTEEQPRRYRSPLRVEQAQRTRELILDAFMDLLEDRRADDITTRAIAERAGVSQPTVYRHFPDRTALLEGLSGRVGQKMGDEGAAGAPERVEELGQRMETMYQASDRVAGEIRAEVLLNSDPRWYAAQTRRTSSTFRSLVADAFPELDEQQHQQVAGLLRNLGSSHAWLRMREEFGVPGSESGPLTRWAMDLLLAAVRRGELPNLTDQEPTGAVEEEAQ